MGKQIDYPADNVGIDGTVYPTVGENIRSPFGLSNTRWVEGVIYVNKGTPPDKIRINGLYCGIAIIYSHFGYGVVTSQNVYVYSNGKYVILEVKNAYYNNTSEPIFYKILIADV